MASVEPLKRDSKHSERDLERLRNVVPLHTLPDDVFEELLDELSIETYRKGDLLFRAGDTDHVSFYLLEGKVALLAGKRVTDTLSAGTEQARFPVAHVLPRKLTARAAGRIRVARLDSRRISDLLARTHSADYEVDELEEADADDWMSLLLRSRVLQQLPAANIQRVMLNVEQVDVEQGERIIRQGEPGDYFYMLVQGQAAVLRDEGEAQPRELARLGPGDAFGEEALLSDRPRNSTVVMLSQGQVLRLAKEHFVELIKTPLSTRIDFDEAVRKVEQGAVWVDLRSPEEYEADHFPGSVNVPVESLRYQLSSLARDRHYVLYSNSGGRAGVAAFLMIDQGFDVSVLEGGLDRLRAEQPVEELPPANEPRRGSSEEQLAETSELERRVLEAEQRARELEQRLAEARESAQGVERERQEQLEAVKAAVDQARARLEASEQEREAALAERQKAYEEMEALTSTLERLETERTALAERMREIEGLDQKLQARLEKVERELIGERERAESASDALAEISERLNAVMEERQREREQHAQETGQLKEEITALQLELEQTQVELEELRLMQRETAEAEAGSGERIERLEAELAAREQELERLRDEATQAAERIAALESDLRAAREAAEAVGDAEAAESRVRELEQALDERTAAIETLRRETAERIEALESELEAAHAGSDSDERVGELERQVETLRAEAAQAQQWREAAEAAEQRIGELEARIETASYAEEKVRSLQEAVEALEAKLEARETALRQAQDEAAALKTALRTLDSERQSNANAEVMALRAELEELQQALGVSAEEAESLQSRLSEAQEALQESERLRARVAELEQALAEGGAPADADFEARHRDLLERLAAREREVEELRAVIETYVGQITRAGEDHDRLAALEREMTLLREESERELLALREQLEAAERALEREREAAQEAVSASAGDAAEVEAMRQELLDVKRALEERQQALAAQDENRQLLEDSLEDANAELDRLRREMDRIAVESEEAVFRAEEAEKAREQLEEELRRFQEQAEEVRVADLRDERVREARVPLEIDAVWGGTWRSRLLSMALGGGAVLALLEALSFLFGGGELFARLFG